MSERLGRPISLVEAAMPKAFVKGYINAIRSVVPDALMDRARQIVEAHKSLGVPKGYEPVAMARILLVDDDPTVAASCEIMGELAGNTVVIASSVSKAEELIRSEQFDRIVVDGLNGRWVEVLEMGTRAKTSTIVFSSDRNIIKKAKEKGVKAVLKSGADEKAFEQVSELFKSR